MLSGFPCRGGISVSFHGETQCFCPPNLYESFYEYQSQRVSVSIQIGATELRTPFIFLVYLVDNSRGLIDSYYFIRYLSIRGCSQKCPFHLLYSSRLKLVDPTCSVRIDAFEMSAFEYRGNRSFTMLFPFLSVHCLPIRWIILRAYMNSSFDCSLQCHSKGDRCVAFPSTDKHFCRCHPGWSVFSATNRINVTVHRILFALVLRTIGVSRGGPLGNCPVFENLLPSDFLR